MAEKYEFDDSVEVLKKYGGIYAVRKNDSKKLEHLGKYVK